jgi:hypothetical protein
MGSIRVSLVTVLLSHPLLIFADRLASEFSRVPFFANLRPGSIRPVSYLRLSPPLLTFGRWAQFDSL